MAKKTGNFIAFYLHASGLVVMQSTIENTCFHTWQFKKSIKTNNITLKDRCASFYNLYILVDSSRQKCTSPHLTVRTKHLRIHRLAQVYLLLTQHGFFAWKWKVHQWETRDEVCCVQQVKHKIQPWAFDGILPFKNNTVTMVKLICSYCLHTKEGVH